MTNISFQIIFTIASFVLAVLAIIFSFIFFLLSKKTSDVTINTLEKIKLETKMLNNISINYLDKIVEYAIHGKDKQYFDFTELLLANKAESKIHIDETTDKDVLKQQLIFSLNNKPSILYHLYHKISNQIVYNINEAHNTIEYHIKNNPKGIGSGAADFKVFISMFIDLHNIGIVTLKSIKPFEFILNKNMIYSISELYKDTYQE